MADDIGSAPDHGSNRGKVEKWAMKAGCLIENVKGSEHRMSHEKMEKSITYKGRGNGAVERKVTLFLKRLDQQSGS